MLPAPAWGRLSLMATKKTQRTPRKRAENAGLTPDRRRRVLEAVRATGFFGDGADAVGVVPSVVSDWARKHPEFRVELNAARDESIERAGQEAACALRENVQAARRGDMVLVEKGVDAKSGKPYERHERTALNVAAARTLLTRFDRRYTHPDTKQELTVKTLGEAMDELPD